MYFDVIITLTGALIAGISTLFAGIIISKGKRKIKINEKNEVENLTNDFLEKQNEINISISDKIKSLEKSLKTKKEITSYDFSNLALTLSTIQKEFEKLKNNEVTETTILIKNYHQQALQLSKIQFWFSIIAASIGFLFILANIFLYYSDNEIRYIFNIIPGVVMDAIAYLFFRQSNETRNKTIGYFDKLRTDNQKQKSLELVDNIENTKLKDLIYAQIAINTSGVKTSVDDFSKIVSLLNTENEQK